MTNNILGVNNINNPSGYNRKIEAAAGQAFSSVLQSKMNASTMSIADFSNLDGGSTNSKNNNVFGSGGSLYGSNMFSGLSGNSLGSGSGIGSETMLAFIMLAMALGSGGEGSSAMLSSLTDAITGKNDYRTSAYQNTLGGTYNGLSLTGSAYKSTYAAPGTGSYPSSMGKACSPSIVNNVGSRSPSAYNRVVQQFNVETNSRYTPYKNGSTYCNIYVWDVTTAMGAQIPHRVDANGDVAKPGASGVKYMNANSMYDWLGNKGKEYGWKEVSAEEAQRYANMGCPAVASWKNPRGHGHIQMVVPSKDGSYNPSKGVAISQAGSKVIEYGYITDVYKSSRLKDIKYFVHA